MTVPETPRTCGGCTACCTTHQVAEIDKKPGITCTFATAGTGCACYISRPSGCVEFSCAWLKGYGTSGDRPDITNIVLDAGVPEGEGYENENVLRMFEAEKGALESDFAIQEINHALTCGFIVVGIPLEGKWQVMIPEGTMPGPFIAKLVIENEDDLELQVMRAVG